MAAAKVDRCVAGSAQHAVLALVDSLTAQWLLADLLAETTDAPAAALLASRIAASCADLSPRLRGPTEAR
jgi:hypothetical protein